MGKALDVINELITEVRTWRDMYKSADEEANKELQRRESNLKAEVEAIQEASRLALEAVTGVAERAKEDARKSEQRAEAAIQNRTDAYAEQQGMEEKIAELEARCRDEAARAMQHAKAIEDANNRANKLQEAAESIQADRDECKERAEGLNRSLIESQKFAEAARNAEAVWRKTAESHDVELAKTMKELEHFTAQAHARQADFERASKERDDAKGWAEEYIKAANKSHEQAESWRGSYNELLTKFNKLVNDYEACKNELHGERENITRINREAREAERRHAEELRDAESDMREDR